MRNFLLLFSLILSFSSFSQGSKLKAYLDTKQFYAPETGNYIEIYLQFVGATAKFIPVTDGIQAKIAVSIEIFQGENKINSDVYILESPLSKDSVQDDFYEVRRFLLPPGNFNLKLNLVDINKEKSSVAAEVPISIEDYSKTFSISDIEIAEYAYRSDVTSNFQKSGYHIIPWISNFYSSNLTKIPAYFEIYNADLLQDTLVGVVQKIVNTQTDTEIESFTKMTRLKNEKVIPIFKTYDIELLETGTYKLVVELVNRKMEILATQNYPFERSNEVVASFNPEQMVLDPAFQKSITDDSVSFYLASLIPIARPAEIKNIIATLKTKNTEKIRKHLQAFWVQSSPQNSYEAWMKYKIQVQFVNEIYGNNFQDGFETDRGRVYLKYGAPSSVVTKETSPSEYPYEIWTYNKIASFSNKRFIFYNPDLVNNAYRLLHSDMLGETKNLGWQQILAKRNTNNGNVDNPNQNYQQHFGGNSNDLFRQY
jgi:GWxTD domain-containing protein